MTRRSCDSEHYTQADFIRVGVMAGVWVVFYALMLVQVAPGHMSRSAATSVPDWRTAAAEVARLPDPPAPIRDAFAR